MCVAFCSSKRSQFVIALHFFAAASHPQLTTGCLMASASASDPADAGEARNPAEATAMAEAPAVTGAADTPEVTGETDAVEARRLSVKFAAQALAPLAEILSRKKAAMDTEYHANAVLDLKAGEEHVIYFGEKDELENRARTLNQTRPGRHGTSYDVAWKSSKAASLVDILTTASPASHIRSKTWCTSGATIKMAMTNVGHMQIIRPQTWAGRYCQSCAPLSAVRRGITRASRVTTKLRGCRSKCCLSVWFCGRVRTHHYH